VKVLGFRGEGLWLGFGYMVSCYTSGLWVKCKGLRIQGLRFRVNSEEL